MSLSLTSNNEGMSNNKTFIIHIETYREAFPMTCTRDITSWKVTAPTEKEAKDEAMHLAWCANTEIGQSAIKATILFTRMVTL